MSTWLIHNSFEQTYRMPFGAVHCNSNITLQVFAHPSVNRDSVKLHLHHDYGENSEFTMEWIETQGDTIVFSTTIKAPNLSMLLWYYFSFQYHGRTYYYGKRDKETGGVGEIYSHVPPAYQITVYHPETRTPHWYKTSVMYQIFVDRFYNGQEDGRVLHPKKQGLLHAHWDNTPFYIRDPHTNSVVRWDFFGGNLLGVIKKLPYLKELGIGIIYFNPIFEAASNHKYDTGDYHTIDPMFGTNELFQELCKKAKELGISVILDGVFSHTGSDSIYFNREGNYDTIGAYQSKDSKYYPWYRFTNYPDEYESWWGVDVLPNVNEMDSTYQDFIIESETSVLKHWLSLGAMGWRLDVADELPDEFIQKFWRRMKDINPESVLIGEVWEDATNKISYGSRRQYLLGSEMDSTMNYPYRNMVIEFLLNRIDAKDVYHKIMTLYENYPKDYFYSTMNLLGTHDTTRILTVFDNNKKLLKLAALWQLSAPGVPCIYYGDEAGVTGGEDPHNRKTYPWGNEDGELLEWYRTLTSIRNHYDVLKTGSFEPFYQGDRVYGFVRVIKDQQDEFLQKAEDNVAIIVINGNEATWESVSLKIAQWNSEAVLYDVLNNYQEISIESGTLHLQLAPLQGKILVTNRWGRTGVESRKAGVLVHPTSFPSKYGIGDLGVNAYQFVDTLVRSGQKLWQILPLNPVGYGESPYQCFSAFAGNPMLIDIEGLREMGFLTEEDLKEVPDFPTKIVDFSAVKEYKEKILKFAYTGFKEKQNVLRKKNNKAYQDEFQEFCIQHQKWLCDYALFMALKGHFQYKSWVYWDEDIASRSDKAIAEYSELLQEQVTYHKFLQFIFFKQWLALKEYANEKGIEIIGDLPIYIAHDSADVWVHRHLFKLDEQGHPTHVSGVPPDYFSETGQLWGNPIYIWERFEQDQYLWWADRIRILQTMVDHIRIDHFRAFADYWEIPASEKTAIRGQWIHGPGNAFFTSIQKQLGDISFIAEDLGNLSPVVHDLKNQVNFPGMKVLQFSIDPDLKAPYSVPLTEKNTVVYTGTHDNDTTLSWYRKANPKKDQSNESDDYEVCWSFIEKVYVSDADIAIIPLQDVLCLDSKGRMNTPGTTMNNWSWRFTEEQITRKMEVQLLRLSVKYKR